MDAFDNPARNGMAGPQRDGASSDQSNHAVSGSDFLAAAAQVTAAASIMPLAIQAILVPDASGRIVLPAGASIDDITVSGADLIITLPNGQVFIIPGGAVDIPAIVLDGDTVPASTVAQLLENLGELNPEAGGVRSSGGNFAESEGAIQDPYALGDLLPYTELAFPQPEQRELLPNVVDDEPEIVIVTPDQPTGVAAATASVNEAGLPARGGEPAGSNSAANSETTTGSIVYDARDGLASLTINGTAITAVGQVITTPLGQLTITSLTPGNVGYSYTLTDNTNANNNLTDPFTVVVTDNDGDTATATLTISVVDDVPTARNDSDQVAAGSFAPEAGNVLTGAGTTSGAAGADTPGADGATLTGIRGASGEGAFAAPGTVQGQYGTLTINAQGGYTYVRTPGTPGGVNDVFTYQITDGDGDTSTATLTISIADSPTVITFVPGDGEGNGGTIVYEADLAGRAGEAPGSAFDGDPASTGGTITFTAIDGIGSVSIGGTVVTPGSLPQTVASDATGTLVVTGYSYNPATGQGSITYVYTLIDNVLAGDGSTVNFPIVITDADGDAASDTLAINIVDDAPVARADVDSVTEDGPLTADGNVLTGLGGGDANATDGVADTQGSDSATVTGLAGGTVGTPLAGAYGTLTLNADGSYSYVLNNAAQPVQGLSAGQTLTETFTYTITDGDGDTSTTTLTITINGADDGVTINGLNGEGAELIVNEDDLADGSSPDAAALTQTGNFTVATPDGLGNVTVGGTQVVTNGVFTAGTATSPLGVINITGFTPVIGADGSVIGGTFTYNYVLSDNTLTHANPGEDFVGDSFAVVVTDSDGSTANASLDVRIIDDVPTAGNDSAGAIEDTPVTINVLGNDVRGADGVDAATGVALATAPTKGSVVYNGDGTFTYTPTAGEEGTDSFTYTITDGDGDTSTATVTVTLAQDSIPTIDLGADNSVNEAGLPTGSDAASNSETTTGSFTLTTGNDSVASLVINGVDVTAGGTVTTPSGVLTVTVSGGAYSYSYTLTSNTSGDNTFDSFTAVVTDSDGDTATDTLVINIVDDIPTARADADSVTEDGPLTADGNVLTGTGGTDANATDGVADTLGADGATVTGLAGGTVGAPLAGAYGTLTLNADGSYSYVLNNAAQPVQGLSAGQTLTETFTYTITDGDGDPSTTTLTITINGADDGVTINGLDAAGAELFVDEDDLPTRGGEAPGSDTTPDGVTASNSFTVSTPDGMGSVVLNSFNGVPLGAPLTLVVANGAFTPQSVATAYGTLNVTGFTAVTGADGSVIGGTFTYSYTLTDNRTDHPAAGQDDRTDSVGVTVTDSDGSTASATIDIRITDDVPTAVNDAATQAIENAPVTINVLANDVQGADSVQPGAVQFVGGSLTGTGTLVNNGDGSFTYTPGAQESGAVTFQYQITDGDGDTSVATATITLAADSAPQIRTPVNVTVDEDGLAGANADNGLPGEVASTGSASANGTITVGFGNDVPATLAGSLVLNDSAALDTHLTVGGVAVTFVKVGADLVGSVAGNEVIRISLTTATAGPGATEVTYGYTVTLSQAIDQAVAGSEDSDILSGIGFTVTDSDGTQSSGSFGVTIVDDLPTLNISDTPISVVEGATAAGTWTLDRGADGVSSVNVSFGAGSATLSLAPGSSVSITQPTGTLTVNSDGTFSFAAAGNQNNAANPSASFTLSAVDRDGDPTSDSLTIAITDGANPVGAAPITLTVSEAALADGSNPFSPAEVAVGSLSFTAGSDALSGFAFSGVAGLATNLDGVGTDIIWTLAPGGQTITGSLTPGGPAAITISLTAPPSVAPGATASATVTVTLADNLHHAPINGPQIGALGTVTVQATDTDGDIATGVVTVQVVDDVPTAKPDVDSVTEDGPLVANGNVMTGVGGDDANTTDGVRDTQGADGATVTGLAGGTVGTPLVSTYGTLTLNADGSYSYVLNNANPAVQALSTGQTLTETFTYTLTDGDGDFSQTTLTITINGANDTPTLTVPAAGTLGTSVAEAGLAAGSASATNSETTTGSFSFTNGDGASTLTIGGQPLVAGNSYAGDYGTLTITSIVGTTVNYSYTLTANVNHATDLTPFESFAINVSDSDGNPADDATATLRIDIVDDVPVAVNDTDSIAAGQFGPATGNVITDAAPGDAGDSDNGADTRGADGAAVSAIVSVNNGGAAAAVGAVSTTINGQYGALTINADGSYSYTRTPGTPGGVSDSFTYTLRDGDGDTATATLTISIADAAPVTTANASVLLDDDALAGGIAGGTGDDVNSQNATGTLSGSGGDGALAFALNATGAPAGFTYVMSGSNLLVNQGATTVLTVTVNPATGAYTVTQNAPIIHAAGLDENNQPFTVNYSVTDVDGDTAPGTLSINVDDDTPTVTLVATNESSILLTTQDAQTIGAASDFDTSTANFGNVFTLTSAYGADGAGTTTLTYGLSLVGANGSLASLASNGAAIRLYTQPNGSIVGSTATTPAGVSAANTIFSLAVNGSGAVTLTQFAEIDHAAPGSTSGPYDAQFATLANGLVNLTGTASITDRDSDTRTSVATVDLGGNIRFADDGPSIAVGAPLPVLTVDESNFGANAISAAVFTTSFGADGPGTVAYSLGINAGSTGLVDTLTGQNVVLTLVGGQVVATAGAGGPTVFTVAVDAGGNITLDQIRAIAHSVDGGPGAAHDDAKTLAAANLITVTGTVTDGDGDSAQASINIGQQLTFKDDGPTVTADSGTTTEATLDFNAAFVLDFSGSIDNTELNTMLNAVRDAGLLLFANSSGDVSIRLIGFASGAANLGVFTDPVSFVNAVDNLNPAQGGTRYDNSATDFTAGIQQLMSAYVPDPSASNQVFFLSDGNPNEQTGPGGSSLTAATATAWTNFVNNNDINVTAIGVGDGISNARLQDIDVDGDGAPILAANFDDLVQTLLDIVVALPVTGDLDANDNFGGDGGRIQSIAISGTTYTWDGNTTITRTGATPGSQAGNSITTTTPTGATLTLNFATGIWSYAPPENPTVGSEVFAYTVVDGDGDTAGSTLTVTVAANGGPGAGNVAIADMVITNASGGAGTAIQIAEAALLANDQAGTVITGAASNVTDATSVTRGGGNFIFTDNDGDGGGFFYSTTPSDSARVTVNRAQAGETTLDGTSANDILIGRDGAADIIVGKDGRDFMYGLGGDDVFNLANGHFVAGELIDGGTGNDGIVLTNATTVNFTTGTIVSVETLTGSSSSDNVTMSAQQWAAFNTINLAGGGNDVLSVNVSGAVNISGASITTVSNTETGNLTGSSGADTLTLTGAQLNAILIGSGTINLGGGADTIVLTSTSSDLNGLSDGGLTNVEAISAAGAGAGVKIILSSQSEAFTVTGSSFGDTLGGGTANDTLTGGAGADQFRFRSTNNGTDTVTDFAAGTDKIAFLDTGATGNGSVNFLGTAGTAAGAALTASDFQARSSIANIASADDNHVILVTAQQTAAQIAASTASATDAYVVVYNTSSARAEIWFDTDWSTTGSRSLVGVLSGVTPAQVAGLTAADFVVYNNAADPIILDLNDDGYAFGSTATFDINADGVTDKVTWNSSNDGILAIDLDGNGSIDNGTEIFTPGFGGGKFATGTEALASLDDNGDGVIDANDAAFANLLIWQDANGDGVSDAGEVSSLADHGIASIATGAVHADDVIDGQTVTARGTFTRTDGSTGEYIEAQLDTQLGTRAAAREAEEAQRSAGNQALANSLVAASLVALATDAQPDNAAPQTVATEDAAVAAPTESSAAAAVAAAPADTASNLVSDSGPEAPKTATPDHVATLHSDDVGAASVDGAQDSGWRSETSDNSDPAESNALFDMIADRASSGSGMMDGLLALGAEAAPAPSIADAAAHDPAATAVLAEVMETGSVDHLLDAIVGSGEPVRVAADTAPAVDLAQLLGQHVAADTAFPISQPLEQDLHNLASA
jgi:VCBS repeat-containing protein